MFDLHRVGMGFGDGTAVGVEPPGFHHLVTHQEIVAQARADDRHRVHRMVRHIDRIDEEVGLAGQLHLAVPIQVGPGGFFDHARGQAFDGLNRRNVQTAGTDASAGGKGRHAQLTRHRGGQQRELTVGIALLYRLHRFDGIADQAGHLTVVEGDEHRPLRQVALEADVAAGPRRSKAIENHTHIRAQQRVELDLDGGRCVDHGKRAVTAQEQVDALPVMENARHLHRARHDGLRHAEVTAQALLDVIAADEINHPRRTARGEVNLVQAGGISYGDQLQTRQGAQPGLQFGSLRCGVGRADVADTQHQVRPAIPHGAAIHQRGGGHGLARQTQRSAGQQRPQAAGAEAAQAVAACGGEADFEIAADGRDHRGAQLRVQGAQTRLQQRRLRCVVGADVGGGQRQPVVAVEELGSSGNVCQRNTGAGRDEKVWRRVTKIAEVVTDRDDLQRVVVLELDQPGLRHRALTLDPDRGAGAQRGQLRLQCRAYRGRVRRRSGIDRHRRVAAAEGGRRNVHRQLDGAQHHLTRRRHLGASAAAAVVEQRDRVGKCHQIGRVGKKHRDIGQQGHTGQAGLEFRRLCILQRAHRIAVGIDRNVGIGRDVGGQQRDHAARVMQGRAGHQSCLRDRLQHQTAVRVGGGIDNAAAGIDSELGRGREIDPIRPGAEADRGVSKPRYLDKIDLVPRCRSVKQHHHVAQATEHP